MALGCCREEDVGRIEPATDKALPCESDPGWWEALVKRFSAPGGRENPFPSWRVTTRIPGRNGGGGRFEPSDATSAVVRNTTRMQIRSRLRTYTIGIFDL